MCGRQNKKCERIQGSGERLCVGIGLTLTSFIVQAQRCASGLRPPRSFFRRVKVGLVAWDASQRVCARVGNDTVCGRDLASQGPCYSSSDTRFLD
ncbi:hypothetical protein P170DRAFT_432960 [Aspergillus steynii IBT 23096]|uniref:Uncharacterized protein n=1 Tax=Aspergillus steynii IBT 23096 TaxID=1392250 RepID=A0A2I2GRB4_9EURO|nr:uncharacterized protein P170DRAFT_432960 [Aspergillus steynii IBT 23096]PLB55419.1 hypothetical protein P170DRAFT_432960 [Aspergillus steynii IBT 23096]